jgi:hypothetical protein
MEIQTLYTAEVMTLKEKLKELTDQKDKNGIRELYNKFSVFARIHQEAGILHGRINDLTIRVLLNGSLVLEEIKESETTDAVTAEINNRMQKNFSCPNQEEYRYSDCIDDFSLLTIATSIYVYSLEPQLFGALHSKNSLLFSKNDFEKAKSSRIFEYLFALNNNFLDILLFQIQITLTNKNPKVENLSSLLQLNEKYHASIRNLKEKEYLQSVVDCNSELIDVLKEKYFEQVVKNTDTRIDIEKAEISNKELQRKYQHLKNTTRTYMRTMVLCGVVMLGYILHNSISGKTNANKEEFAVVAANIAYPIVKLNIPQTAVPIPASDKISETGKTGTLQKNKIKQSLVTATTVKKTINAPLPVAQVIKYNSEKTNNSVTFRQIPVSR